MFNLAKLKADAKAWIYAKKMENKKMDVQISAIEKSDLLEIKWVWEETAKKLVQNWIKTQAELLEKTEEEIKWLTLPLFGERAVIKYINTNKK
jgi:hypothetical protein